MFTVGGQDLQSARLRMPRVGLWSADVRLADDQALTVGATVELVLGDLVLEGVVGPGGPFAGESGYLVTGPAAWMKHLPARGYRDDRGIWSARVVRDLAAELEQAVDGASISSADRVVGYAWNRDAGPAIGALEAIAGTEWWFDTAGALHLGARPSAPLPSTVRASVERYRPELGWALVSLDADQLSSLQPGAVLTDPVISAPFTVADLVVQVSAGAVVAELWNVSLSDQVNALRAQAARPTRWLGLYVYRITQDVGGGCSLVPFGDVPGLPTLEQAPKVYGIPGVSSTIPDGAGGPLVLVGFQGGRPSAPYVAGYLSAGQPGPLTLRLEAQNEIRLGGAAAKPLAIAQTVDSNTGAIVAKLNALCALAGVAPLGPAVTCAAAKTLGE